MVESITEKANIDIFNQSVGIILAELYSRFPQPIDISYNDLAMNMFEDGDDEGAYIDKVEIFGATVSWLEKAQKTGSGLTK
jgi:hypothetical protein